MSAVRVRSRFKIIIGILLAVLSIAYPLVWYFGREQGYFVYLAVLMCALWLIRAYTQKERGQKAVSCLVAAFFAIVLLLRAPQSMYWYPVWVNILMLALFGGSLFARQSLVERMARLQDPDLPAAGVRYTRRVTQMWCLFFIVNGTIAAALIGAQYYDAWALYTGVIAYILMAILGGGEWLYRKYVLKIK